MAYANTRKVEKQRIYTTFIVICTTELWGLQKNNEENEKKKMLSSMFYNVRIKKKTEKMGDGVYFCS